jgi:transposase
VNGRIGTMVLIAVDPHKLSHTAVAVDETGRELAVVRVAATEDERLLRWAEQWPERRWAVEGARGMGHGLSQRLVARGELVLDVPATLVARVRLLSSGSGRKSDPDDARATAEAARGAELHAVAAEDEHAVLRLLTDQRRELTEERTRTLNRLHRLLRELVPGGAPRSLTVKGARALLRGLRPEGLANQLRLELARALIREVKRLDGLVAENGRRIVQAVRATGTSLLELPGVGVVVAALLLGRTRGVERFATAGRFASYAGVAPVEASSGEVKRHRLNRRGDRQLNRALHVAALTQARMPATEGHVYYQRKRAEGKSVREALRCLKRQLANVVYRTMVADYGATQAA